MTNDDERPLITPGERHYADAIIARAMTVEASKLYVLVNLRHLQDELGQG